MKKQTSQTRKTVHVSAKTHQLLLLLKAGTNIPVEALIADGLALVIKARRKRRLWVPTESEVKP